MKVLLLVERSNINVWSSLVQSSITKSENYIFCGFLCKDKMLYYVPCTHCLMWKLDSDITKAFGSKFHI